MDKNKIFLKNRGELSTQWSPAFYHPEKLKYENIFIDESYQFDVKKLKYLFKIKKDKSNASSVNTYIGMANIESDTGLYVASEDEKGKGDCNVFHLGDVLYGKLRPYLNKVYFAEFDGGCSTEFLVLSSLDPSVVSNRFLSIFLLLDCVVKQTKYMMTGSTLPRLQTFDLENLSVPLPSPSIQQKIIDIMDESYSQKKKKEDEAKKILDSIDEYLLEQLGISLIGEKKHTLENRTYQVGFSDVFNNRFDPEMHSSFFTFHTDDFDMIDLKEVVYIDPNTVMPALNTEVTFLPMEKISDRYGIADTSLSRMSFESKGYTKFKNEDLLWSKITPCMENGKSAVVENLQNGYGFGSTEYYVFRAQNDMINIHYIYFLFRLKVFRKNAKLFFTGSSGHQRVDKEYFNTLQIPLPAKKIQDSIVNELINRREKAKILEKEAIENINRAKKEVEKIILGDSYES